MERIGIDGVFEVWNRNGYLYLYETNTNDWLKANKDVYKRDGGRYKWLDNLREEALAKMPKRIEIKCDFGLTKDFQFTITEESREKIFDTMNIDFCNSKFTVTVIIEEVQE